NQELHALQEELLLARQNFRSSRVLRALADAAGNLDSVRYGEAYTRLVNIRSRQADLDMRNSLLRRLDAAAPAWADCIRRSQGVHAAQAIPGDPARAWTWRQLNDELERRGGVSLEALQRQSEILREKIRRVTIDLIDRRAWAFQARRTSSQQRQALIGWLDTIRRIGKGTGLRVPLLRAEAAGKSSAGGGAG